MPWPFWGPRRLLQPQKKFHAASQTVAVWENAAKASFEKDTLAQKMDAMRAVQTVASMKDAWGEEQKKKGKFLNMS